MAYEAESRDTVALPRWGETTGGAAVSGNVVEPSSGKKDTGWLPGAEGIVGEWWNWCHWATGVFFRYIENIFSLIWTRNHVLRGCAPTEGVVTAGTGLAVNVTSARVWISGKMYTVPAATDLPLAAADPTDPRRDLIYARVTLGAPEWAVETGTPAPSYPVPATPAGGCAVYTVKVLATGTVPSTITDVREFGALSVDRMLVDNQFSAGDLGSVKVIEVNGSAGLGSGLFIGDTSNPLLQGNVDLDYLAVDPARFRFFAARTITQSIDISAFQEASVTPNSNWDSDCNYTTLLSDVLIANLNLPVGATVTALRVYGTKSVDTAGIIVHLGRKQKTTGVWDNTGLQIASTAGDPIGVFAEASGSGSFTTVTGYFYGVRIITDGSGAQVTIWGVDVDYTVTQPFVG